MNDQVDAVKKHIPVKDVTPIKIHKPDASKHDDHYSPRSRIYVRKVEGWFETFRRIFGFIFLGIFAIIPWLTYDGRQAVLLDIVNQRFNLFALTLWPQDLTILAGLLIVAAFGLFFVTTLFGRVWCGFMCPQTTWTFIFMYIEEAIEGSRNKRIKLDERPLDFDKFWRKSVKHLLWLLVALLTSMTFVAYFTPAHLLFVDVFTLSTSFWAGFAVLFFTFATYGNAGWMREIMCTHMCPYARFQSAMFDKDTFIVAYDPKRGEKRGPRKRKVDPKSLGLGDCVDCNLCVQVCPTGIDIRNGLQYECISCGSCIDACNGVMDKMGYDKGLISFTTEHQLDGGKTHIIRPKMFGYAAVIALVFIGLVFSILSRIPLDLDVIRDRNQLFRESSEGLIENVYTLKIMNKTQQDHRYAVSLSGFDKAKLKAQTEVYVNSGEVFTLPVSVAVDPYDIEDTRTKMEFVITSIDNPDHIVTEQTTFIYTDR
jgi:cytochrome c oxidase accessory protein FixG